MIQTFLLDSVVGKQTYGPTGSHLLVPYILYHYANLLSLLGPKCFHFCVLAGLPLDQAVVLVCCHPKYV